MRRKLISGILIYIGLTLVLYTVQELIQSRIFEHIDFYYPLWSIYLFHSFFAALIYFCVKAVQGILPDNGGLAFLALSGFKMLGAIIFLVPLIQSEIQDPIPAVFGFFIPYFIYLGLEVIFVIKLLR